MDDWLVLAPSLEACPEARDTIRIAQSVNWRELRAIGLGLQHFQAALEGKVVTVIADNMTALTYLKKRGGHSFSSAERKGLVDLEVGRQPITLRSQFLAEHLNKIADSLARKIESSVPNGPSIDKW